MTIKNLSFSYGDSPVLANVSLNIERGKITTLIGANGCGKTTLLRLMSQGLKPSGGSVSLDGTDISRIPPRAFARKVAVVHQKNSAPGDIHVKKLVSYGRLPHLRYCRRLGPCDLEKVCWAMEAAGLSSLAEKPMGILSGGQRQRAFLAMALAQDTGILMLDEPTTYLDVRYQVEILRLIRHLNRSLGITVVMVLHDINQALAYSDEVIGLKDGVIVASGAPGQVIDSDMIELVYGIRLPVHEFKGYKTVVVV